MRSLYLLVACLVLSFVSSCQSLQTTPEAVVDPDECRVDIIFIGKSYEMGVVVRFALYGTDYSHIVQEITLDDGSVLVECFRDEFGFGGLYDRHTWAVRPHSRTMTVYAANCVGTDEDYGFAHLPGNGRGLSTTVGPKFNEDHQANFETTGHIKSRAENEYYWSISDDGNEIKVIIDGVEK